MEKTIIHIIEDFLKENHYDGLCDVDGCGCSLGDLMPCGQPQQYCRPGWIYPGQEGCDNYIYPNELVCNVWCTYYAPEPGKEPCTYTGSCHNKKSITNDKEIKPCPFCGSTNVSFVWDMFPTLGAIKCGNWQDHCCACGPQASNRYENVTYEDLEIKAIEKWNKHATINQSKVNKKEESKQ